MVLIRCILTFAAFLLLCVACAAQPDVIEQPLGGAGPTVIEAQEILSKIRAGEPLNYDNVTIAGSIDLSHLGGPVKQSVKITNSQFQGSLNFAGVTFNELLDLRGTSFKEISAFPRPDFWGMPSLPVPESSGRLTLSTLSLRALPPSRARASSTTRVSEAFSSNKTRSSWQPAFQEMWTTILRGSPGLVISRALVLRT